MLDHTWPVVAPGWTWAFSARARSHVLAARRRRSLPVCGRHEGWRGSISARRDKAHNRVTSAGRRKGARRLPARRTSVDRKQSGGTATFAGKLKEGTTSPSDNGPGAAQRQRVTSAATPRRRNPCTPGIAHGVEWRRPYTRTAPRSGAFLPTPLQDASRVHPPEVRNWRKPDRRALSVDMIRRETPVAPRSGIGHRTRRMDPRVVGGKARPQNGERGKECTRRYGRRGTSKGNLTRTGAQSSVGPRGHP